MGHRRRQQKLGFGLAASPIARLAQAQLHQTGPAVFGHLPQGPAGSESRTVLKGPGPSWGCRLTHRPRPGWAFTHCGRRQQPDRTLKDKCLSRDPLPVLLAVVTLAVETGRDLSRRTGAAAGLQVDVEVLLGEIRAAGRLGHLGDQGPVGLGERPAGVAVPIGRGAGPLTVDRCLYQRE